MSSEQVTFRYLLLQLHKGESTVEDWKSLLTRQPSGISDLSEFEDATKLFFSACYKFLLKFQNCVSINSVEAIASHLM